MKLVPISQCHVGMEIAQPVFDDFGILLVNAGRPLTAPLLERLVRIGIPSLYIQDAAPIELHLKDDIPAEVQAQSRKTIEGIFQNIQSGNHKSKSLTGGQMVNEFQVVFDQIIGELRRNRNAMDLLVQIQVKGGPAFTHSLNVCIYALATGVKLGLEDKELFDLGIGALFHDIGNLFLPRDMLDKDELSEEEDEIVKGHPTYGFDYLRKYRGVSALIAQCAYQHHEKMDGTGYPRGLKGDQIHIYPRIIAVADLFNTLTMGKGGQKQMLPHEAMEMINACCHTHFDPKVVTAFGKAIAVYPIGMQVRLNSGEMGVIVRHNNFAPLRPRVCIVRDREGRRLDKWRERDLAQELTLFVVECDAIL